MSSFRAEDGIPSDLSQLSDFQAAIMSKRTAESSDMTSLTAVRAWVPAPPARRDANPVPEVSGTTIPTRFRSASTSALTNRQPYVRPPRPPRCTNEGGIPNDLIGFKIAENNSCGTATSAD